MYSVIQSKPVEVHFDEIVAYIPQEIIDKYFINSNLSDRFTVDHFYTTEFCGKRATTETMNVLIEMMYADMFSEKKESKSKIETGKNVQVDIIVEFINLYIKPEFHKRFYKSFQELSQHKIYKELYNFVYHNKEIIYYDDDLFQLYESIFKCAGLTGSIQNSLAGSVYEISSLNTTNAHKIFQIMNINIFQKLVHRFELHEPVLMAYGYDITVLHKKKLKYDSRDLR